MGNDVEGVTVVEISDPFSGSPYVLARESCRASLRSPGKAAETVHDPKRTPVNPRATSGSATSPNPALPQMNRPEHTTASLGSQVFESGENHGSVSLRIRSVIASMQIGSVVVIFFPSA